MSDRDYVVATPEHRRRSRLCHINMLKPYLDRESVPLSSINEDDKTVLALSSAEIVDEAQVACPVLIPLRNWRLQPCLKLMMLLVHPVPLLMDS